MSLLPLRHARGPSGNVCLEEQNVLGSSPSPKRPFDGGGGFDDGFVMVFYEFKDVGGFDDLIVSWFVWVDDVIDDLAV